MAIDTVNKKLALIEYGDVFQPGIPISADGIGQDDKQQLLWEYPGILWSGLVAGVQELISVSGEFIQLISLSGEIAQVVGMEGEINQTVSLSGELLEE